jgi:hypothetical protein
VPPRRGEVGPPFPVRGHGEPLDGVPSLGALRGQWPTAGGIHDNGIEPSHMGETLRPPKWSVMNSRLSKRMVLPRENPPHNKRSPPAATVSTDDGTIGTSRGKARCKCPFLARQLQVLFSSARYRVVKITCSCSKMVL